MASKNLPADLTSAPGNTQTLLRVARAVPKDAGRGLARLDPADMERLGVAVDDVVIVTGRERATALKVMPMLAAGRGKRQVQIDGIARENSGASLDDRVAVELADVAGAQAVTLTAIGVAPRPHAHDGARVGPCIIGLPVTVGERVSVNTFGSRAQNYTVTATDPAGFVVITPATSIQIKTPRGRAASGSGAGRCHIRTSAGSAASWPGSAR